jgi:AraC-like DNA-binding protein
VSEESVAGAAAGHGSMPIIEIAFATGFNDLSHFCHLFQRRFGSSAGRWRGQHKR